jgi:hypothetical protein
MKNPENLESVLVGGQRIAAQDDTPLQKLAVERISGDGV